MLDLTIGFIGSGQMARALGSGFVAQGLIDPQRIVAHDPFQPAIEQFLADVKGARSVADNSLVVAAADLIVLAVKPQYMSDVTSEIAPVNTDKLVVSIAAGVTLATLASSLGTQRIIRVMPNTPCLIGKGAAGYALGEKATPEDGEVVAKLLAAVGIAFELQESLLDAVTGLSGSGPAYVFNIIEALSDGGVLAGLPRDKATALAAQTVLGAAAMVQTTGTHPAVLKDQVASPGGTTIAGLQALENGGLRAALIAAVQAATNRSIELGGEE